MKQLNDNFTIEPNDYNRIMKYIDNKYPSFTANFIALSAISPYPYPRLSELKVFLNPNFSAKVVISNLGSAPGDNININGVY